MKLSATNRTINEPTDEIWQKGLLARSNVPISQWQAQLPGSTSLAAASQSLVLQKMTRPASLREMPNAGSGLRSAGSIPQGKAVLVMHEYEAWYLVAVMQAPWQIGWVEREAVAANPNLTLRVNDEHYLVTSSNSRGFTRIVPGDSYDPRNRMNEPAGPERYKLKYIVMHYSTGLRMESTINHFRGAGNQVSAHLIIGRDGRIVQFLPFNRIAYHAGLSWWNMTRGLNDCSIGIELDNAGMLRRRIEGGVTVWKSGTTTIPEGRRAEGRYWKRPSSVGVWETFPEAQLKAAWQVLRALKQKYGIKDILGHDDVNLLYREDPGPLLAPEMSQWRLQLFGRREPDIPHIHLTQITDFYRTFEDVLPNVSTGLHSPSQLPQGSEVTGPPVLDFNRPWTMIKVTNAPGVTALRSLTGWVRTNSLAFVTGRKYTTSGRQPFYKTAGGAPTPLLRLPAGTTLRRQEVRGLWTLVVVEDTVINGETGFQGWIRTDQLPGNL